MIRHAEAKWNGSLKEGSGHLKVETGTVDSPYSFATRFERGGQTNPEELIAGAHAGCFSMALSGVLTGAGHPPTSIETKAAVHLTPATGGGWEISKIELEAVGVVPGLSAADFEKHAQTAKTGCPVSKALAGTQIHLKATLAS